MATYSDILIYLVLLGILGHGEIFVIAVTANTKATALYQRSVSGTAAVTSSQVIREIDGQRGPVDCATSCMSTPGCNGINYKHVTGSCQLLNTNSQIGLAEERVDGTAGSDYTHYWHVGLQESHQTQKYESLACGGKNATLRCDTDAWIVVQSANYGRTVPGSVLCDHSSMPTTTCINDVTYQVSGQCSGLQACELEAGPTLYGDTCNDTYKYLNVTYQCLVAMATAAAACPSAEWKSWQSHCYLKVSTNRSFDDAEADCVNKGAHLVSLHSAEEHQFIRTQFELEGEGTPDDPRIEYWIGLNDRDEECGNEKECTGWVYTDNTEVNWLDWADNQPNAKDDETDCIGIAKLSKQFNDYRCNETKIYICKV